MEPALTPRLSYPRMSNPPTPFRVPDLFSDHLVLQRGRSNLIWGWDRPGQMVTLNVPGRDPVSTTADAEGAWRVPCPELPPGGPYTIRLSGSGERVLQDVAVGEVWLASGQSNMEFPLASVQDAADEVARANFPAIREFHVPRAMSAEPQIAVEGEWRVCTPQHADSFSAVAYFFAREIHARFGVPVGILHASWGGTPIEAWTSIDALRAVPGFDQLLDELAELERDAPRLRAEHEERVLAWEREALPMDPGNTGEARGWASSEFHDESWPPLTAPGYWQSQGLRFNGVVWFRRSVNIPSSWTGLDLVLSLGAIDDFDVTYFGGVEVGAHPKGTPSAFRIQRRYLIPGSLVKPGRTVVAVRIFDHFGDGGFVGPKSEMFLAPVEREADRIDLWGDWRHQVEHEIPLVPGEVWQTFPPPTVPEPEHYPAVLYNAMIAPLIPYGLRGALWYQGESSVDRHAHYRDHQIGLIRDWRARWGLGQFPFYLVQLAGYRASPEWPHLREAQSQSLSEPGTGMAVALDIGDPLDIHPRNKRDVGRRLALLALGRTYGQVVECEGPRLEHVAIDGGRATAHLAHAAGLRTHDGTEAVLGFALAGADRHYHPADARIHGETVVVSSPSVPAPRTVRYAWADYTETNLVNAAGLPAVPFRTDGY
jgi:sialate O-acetylesterase